MNSQKIEILRENRKLLILKTLKENLFLDIDEIADYFTRDNVNLTTIHQ